MKLTNQEFLDLKKLKIKKFRDQNDYFLIEGLHLIEEAKKSNLLKFIITSDNNYQDQNIKVKYTSYKNILQLSTTKTPQEYIGLCQKIKFKDYFSNNILVLNNINDPGNLGTLIRTALAFNFNDIIVEGVDIYNSKVLRSSQGAIFSANIFNTKNLIKDLKFLKNQKYKIVGSLLDKKAQHYQNLLFNQNDKIILVLGNESKGITKNIIKLLDFKIYIPINFESLNVAVAGGILMAHLNKKISKAKL